MRETQIREKMEVHGVMETAIRSFERAHSLMQDGASGLIAESTLEAASNIPDYESLPIQKIFDSELVEQTVTIKLNGGLGTSMGLEQVKSLLEVRPGVTFLDLMVGQVSALREDTGKKVRFLLMNSEATSEDTKKYLAGAVAEIGDASEFELMQNWAPKLSQETGEPISWPASPDLEWCPPGHGDVYPSLAGSGWLERLLNEGIRYAFLSNSDNLGAVLDPTLLSYFANSGAPFLMEVTRRTEADRKGGHLAIRKEDQRLILREIAQCPESDLTAFQNIERHRYFNTNNIWLNLEALKEEMEANDGVLPLPVIKNSKTVDPRDKESPAVYQLEQAMGAAIECFEGARAIHVPRSRFAPVKTTGDLLALRSDAYELREGGKIELASEREGIPPVVSLSSEYKFVDSLKDLGVPSLLQADHLMVEGPVRFSEKVVIQGVVSFLNPSDQPMIIEERVFVNGEKIIFGDE